MKPNFALEYLEKIAAQFKLNLRPLLINVDFSGVADTTALSKAINFLRKVFKSEQILSNLNPDKFPVDFISDKSLRYFYQTDKKSKKKQIRVDRYEFLVYQSLANAIDAGDLNCRESLKFRSFEDDLIDDKIWEQKDLLIKQANLPILSEPIELHLNRLENRLEECLRDVNRRISGKENELFNQAAKSSRWSLKYPTQAETHSDSFFDSISPTDLYQVLRFVDEQTGFVDAFTHLRGKYAKQKAEKTTISACLIAWGTNTGLGKIG